MTCNSSTVSSAAELSHLPRLGIDVSKACFDACLVLADSGKSHCAQFANTSQGFTQLQDWLAKHGVKRAYAALEATGSYGQPLLWQLHGCGHAVCLLNPRHVKNYARSLGCRVKTDRVDAQLIAAFVASHQPALWQPPAQGVANLQALVRRRHQVQSMLQAERNRQEGKYSAAVAGSLQRHIRLLVAEIKTLDEAIDKLLLEDPSLQKAHRLLCSIHGVGRLISATILAEIPAIESFRRAREVAAFAGVTPSLATSGSSVRRRGRLTKEGSALLRKMLFMAAFQAVKRPRNAFHASYQAFIARGKPPMCALGALMHKILRVAFGVLKHQTPFAANLASLST